MRKFGLDVDGHVETGTEREIVAVTGRIVNCAGKASRTVPDSDEALQLQYAISRLHRERDNGSAPSDVIFVKSCQTR